jgi:histidine ammonia-lyase
MRRPIGLSPLRLEEVVAAAEGRLELTLDEAPELRARVEGGLAFVERALQNGRTIYGVTTGFGASVRFGVDPIFAANMPMHLMRYHGAGVGPVFDATEGAAVMVARLASLSRGYSGVRPALIEALLAMLRARVIPAIPSIGSVGASGDLTPLSYLAAALVGEREAHWKGEIVPAAEALAAAGLAPLDTLRPKESLALMNGTSVMAGLGALAFVRAERLVRWASTLTAAASDVLRGNPGHFDARIFELKAHPGSQRVAAWIREGVGGGRPARVQDVYSLRCAPHVLGILVDALPFCRGLLETELNGVSDNPLIDAEADQVFHGGNFYGGHACLATDTLKGAVAQVAELLERQLMLLNDPDRNAGLPANLVGATTKDRWAQHGYKGLEITASALTAEALKLTMPTASFSRSTESHNQDKVSMGTLSAREALRALDLAETVAAIHTSMVCQAIDLRGDDAVHPRSRALRDAVRSRVAGHDRDRRMDVDLPALVEMARTDQLPLVER